MGTEQSHNPVACRAIKTLAPEEAPRAASAEPETETEHRVFGAPFNQRGGVGLGADSQPLVEARLVEEADHLGGPRTLENFLKRRSAPRAGDGFPRAQSHRGQSLSAVRIGGLVPTGHSGQQRENQAWILIEGGWVGFNESQASCVKIRISFEGIFETVFERTG